MDLTEIIAEIVFSIEDGTEAKIALKKGFGKEFICKVIQIEKDKEGFAGQFVTLQRSESTTGFPEEGKTFVTPLSNIKHLALFQPPAAKSSVESGTATETRAFEVDIEDEVGYAQEFVDDLLADFEDEFEVGDLNRLAALNEDLIGLYGVKFRENWTEDNIEVVYRCLYLALQNRCNLLTLANSDAGMVELSVDDMAGRFPDEGYEDYLGAKNWIGGMLFALIGRDKEAVRLHQTTSSEVICQREHKPDAFYLSYIRFLKSLGTDAEAENLSLLQSDLTLPAVASREYLDCLILPQVLLWETVLNRDESAFNQALENGVEKFHQYWSQRKDDDGGDSYRCNYPEGFVAMGLTAIAAYAYDQGLEVTYRSDYLPRFFIEGYLNLDAKVTWPI